MSFISSYTKDYAEINIPLEVARKMLAKDEEALEEFALLINKFVTWIDDIQRINTKRVLNQPVKQDEGET